MKICVINGSPRGKYSTTVHTSLYLQKRYPNHEFDIVNVATTIKLIEKSPSDVIDRLLQADLLIFSYPVYTFIAPSQLHRFVRVLKESGVDFSGKFATQISTSKHFYDVTAHNYIQQNCQDMGMHFIKGLSADMEDLTCEQGRVDAEKFFEYAIWCVENNVYEKAILNEQSAQNTYQRVFEDVQNKSDEYDTVIVTDLREDDDRLKAMIEDFQAIYPHKTRIINLATFAFKGGCIGCFNCAGSGECIYKDGFSKLLREDIQNADSIVYAFTVEDHSMGTTFKTYDDRQFCNGHRTVSEGKPFAYIVNGDIQKEQNLKTILEARAEVGHNFLAGIACDSDEIKSMSDRLVYALENEYVQPRNFYGVGGMKIFRDLIWTMRGLMKADHLFYKSHGLYNDFPQKHKGKMYLMCLLGAMVRNPKIKAKMGNMFNEGMVMPYKNVLENTHPKETK